MLITNAAIRNRTTVLVFVLLIILSGITSYLSLPRESTPDITIPYIVISTANPGASPADVEDNITDEIEQKLSGIKGMKEFTSTSAKGISMITVEFHPGMDITDALQRVKDRVDLAGPELRKIQSDDPVEPTVSEINISEVPILMVTMTAKVSPTVIKEIAEDIEDTIESQEGVLGVDLLGIREREIVLEVDPDRFSVYQMSIAELLEAISGEHLNETAGDMETPGIKFSVRIPGEITNPEMMRKFPFAPRGSGSVFLSDIGVIRDTFKDRGNYSRLDGESSVTFAIRKRTGTNIVEIAQRTAEIFHEANSHVPMSVKFDITYDESKQVGRMIWDLENNIFTALVLVFTVLVLFMGLRSSLIVAASIPLSMLMSFAVIQMLGVTLNMVVLFGLILALGMLVDNAIVIVENIYRYMEMGHTRLASARKGTAEVAWPVIASTATTIAAFSPILFWPGLMGEFMSYVPLTVIIVLSSSLVVAMVINPVICAVWGKPAKPKNKPREPLLVRGYRKLLYISIHNPLTTIALALCLLVGIMIAYDRLGSGVILFPDTDPDQGIVRIRCPQGTNINETNRIASIIEKRLLPLRINEKGQTQIDHIVVNVGTASTGGQASSDGGVHTADITLVFPDYEDRVVPSADILNHIRTLIDDIPGCEVEVNLMDQGPPVGKPVTIRVIGKKLDALKALSEDIKDTIRPVANLVDLRSDLETAKPEFQFDPDHDRIAKFDASTADVSMLLKASIFGTKVGDFRQFTDEYDIRIRLGEDERSNMENLLRWRVPTREGLGIPIRSLGKFAYRPGLGTIHRINRNRVVTITAESDGGRSGEEVLKDVMAKVAKIQHPSTMQIEYAGEREETTKAQTFLVKAFAIAILLIIIILVMQFNTLSAPLIIMTTVLLSLIGVYVGLLAMDMPFGIVMTGVGVISLAGVVVNNAIVLLDYTRQLQKQGKDLLEAALEAGCTRLRPVLLTAATTILGLLPMVTGISFDFHTFEWATRSSSTQWWSSMAVAVVFGLGFATLLTLLVVPSLYVLTQRIVPSKLTIDEELEADER
ncbi:MAG: efflux RND transporter permease subunit [Phycisphaerales bacterium]|jgi:multidrug efflux pump|nr:efflux RND transporter permease subunit [Phycisphaerales bacterium]MBT7171184.1 efflux RND transporter permease subunit [Phycisphaerales bacterium]